jgi:predicted phosphodiesterase
VVTSTGGPGAVTIDGLEPDQWHDLEISGSPIPGTLHRRAHTEPALPGPELVRLATLSDLHIGSDRWDLGGRMHEKGAGGDIHTVRCARAALAELQAWGAEHLLLKGDLTNKSQPSEWARLGTLLEAVEIPVHAIPGNHDVNDFDGAVSPTEAAAGIGIDLIIEPRAIDVGGLRVIMFDSAVPGLHRGRISVEYRQAVAALLAAHDGPCLVATHHYPQRSPVATFWPPGVPRGQADAFLDAVVAANPRTLVTSGHTHRHRRRMHGPVAVTEVGSPRDYPGTWAGYVVHESGIRQVVRRIESDQAIGWNERTRRGALGTWGRWSPGRLDERCFTQRWDDPT